MNIEKKLLYQKFNLPDIDWPFPEKFFNSSGYTIHRYSFIFKNGTNNIKRILNPSNSLINVEDNTETIPNILSDEIFYPVTKYIKKKIAEYNAIPTKNFIKESYFLYDKSNLEKKNICYSH